MSTWINYSPNNGNGSGIIEYSTSQNYGRSYRSFISTIKSSTLLIQIPISQYGYGPFCNINGLNPIFQENKTILISIDKKATTVNFYFNTNYKKINLKQINKSGEYIPLTIPQNITGTFNGDDFPIVLNNDIVEDYGKLDLYNFVLSLPINENNGLSRDAYIKFTGWYYSEEHDISGKTGNYVYDEYYLKIFQTGLPEYSLTMTGPMAINQEDNDLCKWKMTFSKEEQYDNMSTNIDGQCALLLTNNDYDVVNITGTVTNVTDYVVLKNLDGTDYINNPDNITGTITSLSVSGTSNNSNYICKSIKYV